jgi:hypothetical protein
MRDLFTHAVFKEAIADIESLGVRVTAHRAPGAKPYAIVGGRSNARWWLIPLHNGRVAASGLALFQPLLVSARYMKTVVVGLSLMGLSRLWARQRVYISGEPALGCYFPGTQSPVYAYFTGTDSPHRKLAVQIMDANGLIKGFAKVSRNPVVQPLLSYEAVTLNHLRTLDLKTAHIPTVLFSEEQDGVSILVTDTLKTTRTTSSSLNKAHLAFLAEMASKTADPSRDGNDGLVTEMRRRYAAVGERLPSVWQRRIEQCIDYIGQCRPALEHGVLSHGDFTPWNTFFVDGRLYVFDWEYADHIYPAGYDLIHFMLSMPQTNHQPAVETLKQVFKTLGEAQCACSNNAAKTIFMTYLCGHTLHYIGRVPVGSSKVNTWDGAEKIAALLDALMAWEI